MIYSKWANMRYQYRNREFWCRGYYVDTVGKKYKENKRVYSKPTKGRSTKSKNDNRRF